MPQQTPSSTPIADDLSALVFVRRLFDIALVAFLLLFFIEAFLGYRSFSCPSDRDRAENELVKIQQVAEHYELRYGQPPTSHGQLVDAETIHKPIHPIDPWGTPYEAFVRHDGTFVVSSAGPDRVFATLDDVYEPE
jgi:hypothetical protein